MSFLIVAFLLSPFPFPHVSAEAFDYLDAPVERLCGVDVPMPYAANLEDAALPQTQNVVNAVKRVLNIKMDS